MLDGQITDLTLGELRSVIATIAGINSNDIRDWMIVISTRHDCGDLNCEAGDIVVINSGSSEHLPVDSSEPVSLQLAADLVRSIAVRMAER